MSKDSIMRSKAFRLGAAYVAAYFLGIAACLLFTDVEPVLAGQPLWHLYPFLAVIGFPLFYLYLDATYTLSSNPAYWTVCSLGFLAVVQGIGVHFIPPRRYRSWGPLLAFFAIGFVGTMGVYYTAAASI